MRQLTQYNCLCKANSVPMLRRAVRSRAFRLVRASSGGEAATTGGYQQYSSKGGEFTPLLPPDEPHTSPAAMPYQDPGQAPPAFSYSEPGAASSSYSQQQYTPQYTAQYPQSYAPPQQQYTPTQQPYPPSYSSPQYPPPLQMLAWSPSRNSHFSLTGLLADIPQVRNLPSGLLKATLHLAVKQSGGGTHVFRIDTYGDVAEAAISIAPQQPVMLAGELRQQAMSGTSSASASSSAAAGSSSTSQGSGAPERTYMALVARRLALIDPATIPTAYWPDPVPVPRSAARKAFAPGRSAQESFNLYTNQGMNLQQVAEARGFQSSTVLSHILEWAGHVSLPVDWDRIKAELDFDTGDAGSLSMQEVMDIVEEVESSGTIKKLTAARMRLAEQAATTERVAAQEQRLGGPSITYNQIKLAMAWRQHQQKLQQK